MRCDAMRCDAMRCDAMRCDAMRCDAMRCDAMRCDATRWKEGWSPTTLHVHTRYLRFEPLPRADPSSIMPASLCFSFFFFCLPRVDYPRFTRRSIVSRYVIPRFYIYSRTARSRGYAEEIHGISNNWDLYRTLSSPMIAILFDLIDLLYNYNTYLTIQSSTP